MTPDKSSVRILIADDDPAVVRLMSLALTQNGFPPPREASTGAAALEGAAQADILLLDYQLPDLSGTQVLEQLQHTPDPPSVVVVTAHGGEQVAAEALRLGADDYLAKDAALVELLPEVVERVRRTRALRSALVDAERELLLAARREAIGEMTVTLHHEINNPLMTAFAEVSILLADEELNAQQRHGIEELKGALDRIRDILRQAGELQAARAVEYVKGVSMMDLSALPEPTGVHGQALVYLESPSLARVTELLLQRAGYEVERVDSAKQLEALAASGQAEVVVVADTTRNEGPAWLGPKEARDYRVVVLTADDGTEARAAGADAIFPLPFDPAVFVERLAALGRGS